MHLPTFKWTACFLLYNRNILLLQANEKYKVVRRKQAVRKYWIIPGKDRY